MPSSFSVFFLIEYVYVICRHCVTVFLLLCCLLMTFYDRTVFLLTPPVFMIVNEIQLLVQRSAIFSLWLQKLFL